MPCMSCKNLEMYNYYGRESNFCRACFEKMFPNAFRRQETFNSAATFKVMHQLSSQQFANAVMKFAVEGEARYCDGTTKYGNEVEGIGADFDKVRFSGTAMNCHAAGMIFTPAIGKRASQAVLGFFASPQQVVCECHTFVLAVYYRALLECLTDTIFDLVFRDMCIEPGVRYRVSNNPLKDVLEDFDVTLDESSIRVGDWVYVANRTSFNTEFKGHPAVGWNLICISEDPRKYIGLGLGNKDGQSLAEILAYLDDEYEKLKKKKAAAEKSTSRHRSNSGGGIDSRKEGSSLAASSTVHDE